MSALACQDVTLAFGGVVALNGIQFTLTEGECVGLIGPNGAGKTSLLNCLTGFYRPSEGTISVNGTDVRSRQTAAITALGVARTFQQAESLSGMGARDVMLLGRERFLPMGFLRYALPLPGVRRGEAEAKATVYGIAEELGIAEFVRRNVAYEVLPYGVRKLVDLGRALACEPSILLMDEPAAGLSAEEKQRMIDVIRNVGEQRNLTRLLVDHDINFVSAVVTRMIVLDAGTLIADGPVDDVLGDQRVIESYIGRAEPAEEPPKGEA